MRRSGGRVARDPAGRRPAAVSDSKILFSFFGIGHYMSHPLRHRQPRYEKLPSPYPESHSQESPDLPANGAVAARFTPHPRRGELPAGTASPSRTGRGHQDLIREMRTCENSSLAERSIFAYHQADETKDPGPRIGHGNDLRGALRPFWRAGRLMVIAPGRSLAPSHARRRHFPINPHDLFV